MNRHRISMQGCIPGVISDTKFLRISSLSRAPLSGAWTPIIMLTKRGEKAISKGTLNQWTWDAEANGADLTEYQKAADAYDYATNPAKHGRA